MQVLRQGEGCGMDRRIVVTALETCLMEARLDNLRGEMTQDVVIRRPGKGHDPAVVGRNGSLIEANIAKIGAQLAVAVERFILLQEADAILRHEDTARVQTTLATLVER